MRKMILDEVVRFRTHVRHVGAHAAIAGGIPPVQQANVPIPANANQWGGQDPRPQEAGTHAGNDLEDVLAHGMDTGMRR